MWVPGSIAFLLPVAWIVGQVLSPQYHRRYAHNGHDAVMLSPQRVVDERMRLGSRHEGENMVNKALDDQTHMAQPHVIIVGGGFGGLAAARALKNAPVRVTLIDRRNHHLFQPLLYQVATAMLSSADIASPIREVLRKQANTTVAMLEVTRVDADKRWVFFNDLDGEERSLPYDYLILATGVQQSYFGHDEFAPFAPGLKSTQ